MLPEKENILDGEQRLGDSMSRLELRTPSEIYARHNEGLGLQKMLYNCEGSLNLEDIYGWSSSLAFQGM